MSVGPGFFRTMRMSLLRGREFTGADTEHSPPVAVLSESASRLYFGGQDPVGKRFSIPGFDPQQKIEIVGVARDAKLNSLREPAPATVYLPFLQAQDRGTSATPASLEVLLSINGLLPAEKLRALIQAASPDLAVVRIRTQRALVERSLVQEHMLSQVSAGFGTLGLLCMRLLRSALFGVGPWDVPTTAWAVLVLGGTAIIAAWIPAYRASQIDPAAAIRDE